MARTLDTLNEQETQLVQDFVDMMGCTEDEALQMLIDAGTISGTVGGSGSYIPEGFAQLDDDDIPF